MFSVTQIVWKVYEFRKDPRNPDRDYFQESLAYDRLKDKSLVPESIAHRARHLDCKQTLRVLNTYGSFAHRMAKRLVHGHDVTVKDELLTGIRQGLLDFYDKYQVTPILNEWTFSLDWEYSGTLDMVCEIEWKHVRRLCVLDFKTYALYKDLYGIPHDDKESTPLKKLKMVWLQCSMYANALRKLRPDIIGDRGCMLLLAWLTPEGVFVYELEEDISPYQKWVADNFIS